MNRFNAKPLLVVALFATLSTMACSPAVQPSVTPSAPAKVPEKVSMVQTDPNCTDQGGTCVASGTVDLAKRGYNAVKDQVQDPENQEAAGKLWDSIKQGAEELYEKGKEAVK